ncbi:MAG: peptidylprolyl isomerase [Rickettsiales bacterium]|jgi:peptidylprolyl isomerase|nr:peptidylprolyl isomerase [Rickettsiales bacterium]
MFIKIFIVFLFLFTISSSEEIQATKATQEVAPEVINKEVIIEESAPQQEQPKEQIKEQSKESTVEQPKEQKEQIAEQPKEEQQEVDKQTMAESQVEEALTSMQNKNKRQLEPKNTLYIELKDNCIVTIELLPSVAPRHVQRIRELSADAFYDGVVWHRVIEGFMAQTGDPTGTGNGGSRMGRLSNEFNNERHVRGTVSMARAESVDSANSQFFIVTGNEFPELDGKYTVFGRVMEGMDCVDKIKVGDYKNNGAVKDPDKMITVITGDLLNNKSLEIVKREINYINDLQNEKVKQDPKYNKHSVLALLLAVKDIDITSELEVEKKEEEDDGEGIDVKEKLGDAGIVAEAVGDALMENKYTKGVVGSFKDITNETFKNVKTISDKAGEKAKEDVASRTAEKKKEKAVKKNKKRVNNG